MTRRWKLLKLFFLKEKKGSVAVEFALVIPALLLLIVGGMDFGHMLYIDHLITNASREGARYAARYTGNPTPTSDQISTYVKTTLNYTSFHLDNFNVTAFTTGSSPNTISTVTVTADKHWWILGSLFQNPKTLAAQTAMVCEGP